MVVAACGGGNGGSQNARVEPPPVDLAQVLDDFVAANSNVSSLAMLVVKDGNTLFSHSGGFMDLAKTRPPTEDTLYKTSSIAKLIIAVAVMQQVELGLVNLDDDIGNYLPFAVRNPDFADTVITVRMLMQHAAGLSNPAFGETTDELFEVFDPAVIVQLHPLIEDILTPVSARYRETVWLAGEPGSVNRNSNLGMVLLAYLVEQLSGLHYIDYCKFNIFQPLGMTATSHYFPDLEANEVATLLDDNNQPVGQTSNWFYPIGGLFTSTGDWSRFMQAILNGGELNGQQILSADSVSQMLTTTTPGNNQIAYDSNIGLIWREAAANPGWIGHTGAGTQMTHVTELNPATNTAYVLFTNEGRIDALIGPGSALNATIHQWLLEN